MPNDGIKNLNPLGRGKVSPEVEHDIRVKGGRASVEARRKKRDVAKLAQAVMAQKPILTDKQIAQMEALGFDTSDVDMWTLGLVGLFRAMAGGDSRAAKLILELTGNDPNIKLARERMKLERDKFKLQKQQYEDEKARRSNGEGVGQLDRLISGLQEIRDSIDNGE